jgi:translation initiation factor RLI1
MPRLKIEEVKQLSEPIIIDAGILSEKEYCVEKVTAELMKKVDEIAPKKDEKGNLDALTQQLGLLLNVPAEEFSGVDLRVAGKVLSFISDSITAGVKELNPTAAGAKQ